MVITKNVWQSSVSSAVQATEEDKTMKVRVTRSCHLTTPFLGGSASRNGTRDHFRFAHSRWRPNQRNSSRLFRRTLSWFPEGKLLAFWASTEEWKFGWWTQTVFENAGVSSRSIRSSAL